ncbi:BtrH N-terminal domain-containing protein [Paenibacillus puerhi]|uniref:BtrH N-terminal domain-containing protein n=1 Tax=Paenibacillus puerhi TaxID=2692622 RepID=UPI001358D213|nr:BtrH N-terminal domain-containing protein [Paenibacillus puerhi]
MSIIIPRIKVQPGTHCLFASLRNMMQSGFGVNLSEAEIYFRCDGMNVEYMPETRPFWIGCSGDEMLRHFAEDGPVRLRYSFEMNDWHSKQNLVDELVAELASGKLVMLFAQSHSLTYHFIYRENPSRPHVIFLYGVDTQNDSLFIGDSFLLDYSGAVHMYQGPASLNNLMEGIYGVAFMEETRVEWSNHFSQEGSLSHDERAFISLLQERIRTFLDNRSLANGESVQGLQAYYAFFDGLEAAAAMNKESFTESCKEVYYCLRIGSIMHQWTYLMQIVQEYPKQFSSGADFWIEKLETEHTQWKKHLLNMYKIGLRGNQESWPSILKHSKQLLDQQRDLLHLFVDEMTVPAPT